MIKQGGLKVSEMSYQEMIRREIPELLRALVYEQMKLCKFGLIGYEISQLPEFDFMRLGEYFEEAGLSSIEQIEPVFLALNLRQRVWLVRGAVDAADWERNRFQKSLLRFKKSLIAGDLFGGMIRTTEPKDFRYNESLNSLWSMVESPLYDEVREDLIRVCLNLTETYLKTKT